jgi:hypothetical protein
LLKGNGTSVGPCPDSAAQAVAMSQNGPSLSRRRDVVDLADDVADVSRAAALGLHEGIGPAGLSTGDGASLNQAESGKRRKPSFCARWPKWLCLESSMGEQVAGRCGATNLCDFCAGRFARETTEMLKLDAMHGVAPTI